MGPIKNEWKKGDQMRNFDHHRHTARKTLKNSNIQSKIEQIIMGLANFPQEIEKGSFIPVIFQNLKKLLEAQKRLTFILPAFPAKSANREKTSGSRADMAEVLALIQLQKFCENINAVYEAGAEVLICSDGKVFNDLVLVSEDDLLAYKESIKEIIQDFSLSHLKTFCLEDHFGESHQLDIRESLVEGFGPSLENIKNQVRENPETKVMFNGLHRFIKEDMLGLIHDKSKNQISKESKEVAYKVIQRSRAWDSLLESLFKDTLRLSIHPYPLHHPKFGVKMVKSSSLWATPWHNVALKQEGEFQLMKRKEAENLGAVSKLYKNKFTYYELS